jgi:WD40 repeat protein
MRAWVDSLQNDRQPKAKVFISYSRKDIAFADRLEMALKKRGFEVLIDRSAISDLEDWRKRIDSLIAQSDTVVFMLSPDAVLSKECKREVDFACSLNKRLAPIVCRPVEDETVPDALARISRINFVDVPFEVTIDRLIKAISTDIQWVRKHTEFGEAARRWAEFGHPGPRGLLLRSPVLEEAERWIASRPADAPTPTESTQTFIAESRRLATQRRKNIMTSLVAGLLLALGLAGIAYWQRSRAVEQEQIAKTNEKEALSTQSRFLADLSRQAYESHLTTKATLLALEAVPDNRLPRPRPLISDAAYRLSSIVRNFTGRPQQPMEQAILAGHQGPVTGAAFSPSNQNLLLTWSEDGSARIWDLSRRGTRLTLRNPTSPVLIAAYNSDGQIVMTGSMDGTTQLWNSESGKLLVSLSGNGSPVLSISASRNGQFVVTTYRDKTARIWRTNGTLVSTITGFPEPIVRAAFSFDESILITEARAPGSYRSDAFHIFQLPPNGAPREIAIPATRVLAGAFGVDGPRFATITDNNRLAIIDMYPSKQFTSATSILSHTIDEDTEGKFNSTGTQLLLYSRSRNRITQYWDAMLLSGPKLESSLSVELLRERLDRVAFSETGNWMVATSGRIARAFSTKTGRTIAILGGHDDGINDVALAPDGTTVVTVSGKIYESSGVPLLIDDTARLWTIFVDKDVVPIQGLQFAFEENKTGAFSADMSRIAVNTSVAVGDARSERAEVWDLAKRRRLASFRENLSALSLSPDGAHLFGKGKDGLSRLYAVDGGIERFTFKGMTSKPQQSCFSPNGTWLVIALENGTAEVWNVARQLREAVLRVTEEKIEKACFDKTGQRIATTSYNQSKKVRQLQLWETSTWRRLAQPTGLHSVGRIDASSDLHFALVSEDNFSSAILDLQTGRRRAELKALPGSPFRGIFSPDSQRLLTLNVLSSPTWGTIWNTETGEPIAGINCEENGWPLATFNLIGTEIICLDTQGRVLKFPTSNDVQRFVEGAQSAAPRCLTIAEREEAFLAPTPPEWCIQQKKWPYDRQHWQLWAKRGDVSQRGPFPELPIDEKYTADKRVRAIVWD